TAFHRRPPPLPSEGAILEIETTGRARLAEGGFERYEVSAYARPGFRCTHNLNYWRFGDYLGIGAGAHGKLTPPGAGAIERRAKTRNPRTHIELAGTDAAVSVERTDSPRQIVLEFMMNALRLSDGVPASSFERRTGLPLDTITAPLAAAAARGWIA